MKPELLAPAGSPAALRAAVDAGADAVYFGVQDFNARRHAENFTEESVVDAIRYCHLYGVKTHIVLNIQLYRNELEPAASLAERCLRRERTPLSWQTLALPSFLEGVSGYRTACEHAGERSECAVRRGTCRDRFLPHGSAARAAAARYPYTLPKFSYRNGDFRSRRPVCQPFRTMPFQFRYRGAQRKSRRVCPTVQAAVPRPPSVCVKSQGPCALRRISRRFWRRGSPP